MHARLKRYLLTAFIGLTTLATGCAFITQPLVDAIPSTPPPVDVDALRHHVRHLAVTLHPRSVDHPTHLEAAGDYILTALRATGARTAVQEFDVKGRKHRNLIAKFGPEAGAVLVIGAHYDSHDDTPGADDNASGVAALLELAILLARRPPPGPVELVAYTLEEPPYFRTEHMGSFVHARALAAEQREVRLMISLETLGYFSDAPDTQRFPVSSLGLLYPDTGNFIAVVGRFGDFGTMRRVKALMRGASDLPVESINAPASVAGVDFSDHLNYWALDMPAVMVTDTAFLRNPNYHQTTDTPDTLDYARMAKVVQDVHAVAMSY